MIGITGTAARAHSDEDARRFFENGGIVLVHEGDEEILTVTASTVVWDKKTTTWSDLLDDVALWSNRHPHQRFYLVTPAASALGVPQTTPFPGEGMAIVSHGEYQIMHYSGYYYLLMGDKESGAIPTVKVSRISLDSYGVATLALVDEWYGFADASVGAIHDAQKRDGK